MLSTKLPLSATPQNDKLSVQRLKLTMPTSDQHQAQLEGHSRQSDKQRSATPSRPSYSPVTPTFSQAALTSNDRAARRLPEFIDDPKPLPVSLDENPDAIALRAAISLLQLQKQQTLRDIRSLDKMKAVALDEPDAFVENLNAGNLQRPARQGMVDVDIDDYSEDEDVKPSTSDSDKKFGTLPTPQNIVRMPHVNWDKYHVVGESLEKLHEEQRRRPTATTNMSFDTSDRAPDHPIAAPYNPFTDEVSDNQTNHSRTPSKS